MYEIVLWPTVRDVIISEVFSDDGELNYGWGFKKKKKKMDKLMVYAWLYKII